MKTSYFGNDCLLPPPHYTLKKEDMRQVKTYSKINPYYESKDIWCASCEKSYQHTCAKDYQNVYRELYPDGEIEYKETFYKDYDSMLDSIDYNIKNNPNMTKSEIYKAISTGYSVENFLDSCIAMRLNHHRYCIRRENHFTGASNLNQKDLEGDIYHKKHIKQLKDIKIKGGKIKNEAMVKGKITKFKMSKRNKNSISKNEKCYRSRKTKGLIKQKKNKKKSR